MRRLEASAVAGIRRGGPEDRRPGGGPSHVARAKAGLQVSVHRQFRTQGRRRVVGMGANEVHVPWLAAGQRRRLHFDLGQHETAVPGSADPQRRVGSITQRLQPQRADPVEIGLGLDDVHVGHRVVARHLDRAVVENGHPGAGRGLERDRNQRSPPFAQPAVPLFLPRGLGLGCVPVHVVEQRIQRPEFRPEFLERCPLARVRRRHLRLRVALAAVEPDLVDRVEEGRELVVLALADRIELVVVALGAARGQPHPHRGRRVRAVEDVLDPVLLRDRAALEVDHVVPVETGRQQLLRRRIRQQVAGKLVDGELVERLVRVEGVDHPVAPAPHEALVVDVVAVRVGVAGRVQPGARHVLPVALGREQPVHETLVGVRRGVGHEGVDIGRRRRQAGQVERQTARERAAGRLGRGHEPLALQPGEDEAVDLAVCPIAVRDRGRLRALRRPVRPVVLELRALEDEAAEDLDLAFRERRVGMQGRHPVQRLARRDPLEQLALVQAARHQRPATRGQNAQRRLRLVEAQPRLTHGHVRTVALVAVIREDRPHVAMEGKGLARPREVVLHRRNLPRSDADSSSVFLVRQGPLRAGLDPRLQQVLLGLLERSRRRHLQFVLAPNRRDEQTRLGISRHDRRSPTAPDQHRRPRVEPQVPPLSERSVTGKAPALQHRQYFRLEVRRRGCVGDSPAY